MPLWLSWILLGLIAGSLAKFILPGRDPSGCIFTIFLGIVGALVGGLIGTQLGWGTVTQGGNNAAIASGSSRGLNLDYNLSTAPYGDARTAGVSFRSTMGHEPIGPAA